MTRRQAWFLAGIIGAAAVVRLATLDHQSYDHDEAVTAWRVLDSGLGGTLALTIAGVAAAAIVVPFVLAVAGFDFVQPRNLIGSLVPFLVAAGIGLGCPAAGRLGLASAGAAALLFIVVLAAVHESAQMQRPDWRGAAAAMGPPSGPRVLVVARNGDDPTAYYRDALHFRRSRFPGVRVEELDVLSTLATISPPGKGFRLTERQRMAPCCTLWRYRARRATLVRPRSVAGNQILLEPSSVLVDGVG